jgi:DnaA family protein
VVVKQLAFEFVAPASPTLDVFVDGRNAEVVQRLRELAATRTGERAIYLWGAASSGRTHLLHGALAALERGGARVAYVAGASTPAAEALAEADAVAIDDVERLSEADQGVVFNLYNRLRDSGGVLLAAGNAPPAQLRLRPDVVTRLAWGLVYEVHALSDPEKAQALAEHAATRGFSLPPEVSQHLLTHVRRDMRSLIAMLESLDRYSLETKRPVTLTLVREMVARERGERGEERGETRTQETGK